MTRTRTLAAAAVAAMATAATTVALTLPPGAAGRATTSLNPTPSLLLAGLTVHVEDTGAHYRREDWGTGWPTTLGCSTRERILQRDAVPGTVTVGPGCAAVTGRWVSLYDGVTVTDARALQIDHMVPLAEAQRSGARNWTATDRRAFYLDPANLRAVTIRANTSKGDGDPTRWVPTARGSWCTYAAAYVGVKARYRLTIDQREHTRLVEMLRGCPAGAR